MSQDYEVVTFDHQKAYLRSFIDFPFHLYKDDQNWIPPMESSVIKLLTGKTKAHAFLKQRNFLVLLNGKVRGRVTAFVNSKLSIDNAPLGSIGMFECENDAKAANLIIESACNWLREQGCTSVWGPMDGMIFNSYRMMIEGFENPPLYNEPYNPPYYSTLFEENGFSIMKKWHSGYFSEESLEFFLNKMEKIYQRYQTKGYQFRELDSDHFDKDFMLVHQMSSDSYSWFPGHQELTLEEFHEQFGGMNAMVEQGITLFGIAPDGETIGFNTILPDFHHAFRTMGLKREQDFDFQACLENSEILSYQDVQCGLIKSAMQEHKGFGVMLIFLAVKKISALGKPIGLSLMAEGGKSIGLMKYLPLTRRVHALYQKRL